MKNLFCCFLEQIQLIFNYQHWYRWVVGAIIIFAFDYQILMGIKVFQPVKDLIPLFASPDSGRQRYGKRRSKNHRFFHCRSQLQDRSRICCDRGGATELYRSRYSGTCGSSEKYESTENQYGSLSSAGSGAG